MEDETIQNEESLDLIDLVERLTEVIDRENATVNVLLSASSTADRLEQDHVCLIMRDCCERMAEAKEYLDRIWKAIPNIRKAMVQ